MITAYHLISMLKDPMMDLNSATVHIHMYLATWEYLSMHRMGILNLSHKVLGRIKTGKAVDK